MSQENKSSLWDDAQKKGNKNHKFVHSNLWCEKGE